MKELRVKDILLPESLMPRVKEAFTDMGLFVDREIKDCTLLLNGSKGTCFHT